MNQDNNFDIVMLLQAIAANHRDWFARKAEAAGGGVFAERGISLAVSPEDVILPFPRMQPAEMAPILDWFVQVCLERRSRQASCWSLQGKGPAGLGAGLMARGFEWGWQPHWMAVELDRLTEDFPIPANVSIDLDDTPDWEVDDLPYYSREQTAQTAALLRAVPQRTWRFAARQDGRVVGQCVLHVTEGPQGIAGIYNVGVTPGARRQGIGRAVTAAACHHARSLGCTHAGLNSATHIYDKMGFVSLGHGQTWWLHNRMLDALPVSPADVAFAEAIGTANITVLTALQGRSKRDLDAALPCGLTPLEFAGRTNKIASARWLMKHGATPAIIPLWDLGLKEQVRSFAMRPYINRRFGPWQITPLHEAVARGDVELARLLLSRKADMEAKDTEFNGTPLGWARHFGRDEIIALMVNGE